MKKIGRWGDLEVDLAEVMAGGMREVSSIIKAYFKTEQATMKIADADSDSEEPFSIHILPRHHGDLREIKEKYCPRVENTDFTREEQVPDLLETYFRDCR